MASTKVYPPYQPTPNYNKLSNPSWRKTIYEQDGIFDGMSRERTYMILCLGMKTGF